jgi:hypothetical protein
MFTLTRRGFFRRTRRLQAATTLDAADFQEIARMLGAAPKRARKIGRVSARKAQERQHLETRWNGKESEITVEPDDWIVTTLSPASEVLRDREGHANTYAIKPERFGELYEPLAGSTEFGAVYRAKGVVDALFLSGGFESKAPWGEMQRADSGYLLLNGSEVYGNSRETFEATYEIIEAELSAR